MKNRFLVLISLLFVIAACNKTDIKNTAVPGCMNPNSLSYNAAATMDDGSCVMPEPTQYGIMIEYTATGCYYCGAWGADTGHSIYKYGNCVAICPHASLGGDPMYSAAMYSSFTSARPDGGGIPDFWVGDVANGGRNDLINLLKRTPAAGVTFQATKGVNASNQPVMNVSTMTEFFSKGTGDYYLSVYILESGIDGNQNAGAYAQSGTTNPTGYKHDFVLRTTNTGDNCYGEKISTDPATGTIIKKSYVIPLDATWTHNVYAVAALWHKSGTLMEFVNAKEFGRHNSE